MNAKASFILLVLVLGTARVTAQSTAFTYQGRLVDNGLPASGLYDLHFTLFSTPTNGTPVSGAITNHSLSIVNGSFVLNLDFGASVFSGEPRWIEVGVRTNGASQFTMLQPRQEITRVPYAVSALEVTAPNVARLTVPNTSQQAAGEPVVTSGFITGANVTRSGFGYVTPPGVIVQDATGFGARILPVIEGSRITGLIVISAGTGYSPDAQLVIDPPPPNEYQVFASTNIFAGVSVMTNVNNTIAGVFSGTFTGPHSGAFSGDGAALTNLNAETLQGVSANGFWRIDGTAGTTPDRHFLGTTDNQSLELRANNRRVARFEPTANGSPNLIAGSDNNYVGPELHGVVIAGGGTTDLGGVARTNSALAVLATISGGAGQSIAEGAQLASISGGFRNSIGPDSSHATIAGGEGNAIQTNSDHSSIGGGDINSVGNDSRRATIGGGRLNTIESGATGAVIDGGAGNRIHPSATYSSIGGGFENTILTNAQYGTIPGGFENVAGFAAFAAGTRAHALHEGSFVWADSDNSAFSSTDENQFLVRASGGVGIGTNNPATTLHVHGTDQTVAIVSGSRTTGTFLGIQNTATGGQRWSIVSTGPGNGEGAGRLLFFTHASNDTKMRLEPNGNLIIDGSLTQSSDRARKENIHEVDAESILSKVAALPLATWNYIDDEHKSKHLGPMAQDFHAAFALGESDKTITTIDADGVALAAIQALNRKVAEQSGQIEELRRIVRQLQDAVETSRRAEGGQ